jgi:hypothetical protein
MAAVWLALCNRKVPGSNLDPESDYPGRHVVVFLKSSLPANDATVPHQGQIR